MTEISPPAGTGAKVGQPYSAGGAGAATGSLGAPGACLGVQLTRLWRAQRDFNDALAQLDDVPDRTREEMAQIYILGIHKELSGLLQRLNWKHHRKQVKPPVNMDNVADDLSDLTKYVWCLWQLFGFDATDMLERVAAKTDVLWQAVGTEFRKPEPGQPVLMVDLDNTVARYTEGLDAWMMGTHDRRAVKLDTYDMAERYDMLRYGYDLLKAEWEEGGGYSRLSPYSKWIAAIKEVVRCEQAFLVVATARPVAESKRVWYDCYAWAVKHFGQVDRMIFLEADRLEEAARYRERGHPVVVFEDSPAYLPRLVINDTATLVHRQPYNEGLAAYPGKWLGLAPDDPVGLVTAARRMIREQR